MKAKASMTQRGWQAWANAREAEADATAKLYRNQAKRMREMLVDIGCTCDPIITLRQGPDGPVMKNPLLTHSLDCKTN